MKFQDGKAFYRDPEGKSVSVVFAGDICPRDGEREILAGNTARIFADVKPFFQSADCRIVQWETTLGDFDTPIVKCGPNLKSDPRCVEIARFLQADIALLANNHTADFGPDSALQTRDILNQAGIKTVGVGENLMQAVQPLHFMLGDRSVSLLNFAENEFGIARENMAGISPQRVLPMLHAIREEKSRGYMVFVALHGGHERNPYPSPRMVELFRTCIEAGASLLWNCHTHCPEPVEFYQGGAIVYSPGNFFFPKLRNDEVDSWIVGYLTKFHLDSKGVYEIELLPYRQGMDGVHPLTGERGNAFFAYLEKLSQPLTDPAELQRLFNIWCTGEGHRYLTDTMLRNLGFEDHDAFDWDDPENVRRTLGARGSMTCEAHNDLIRQTLLLIYYREFSHYKAMQNEIRKLQNPDFVRS